MSGVNWARTYAVQGRTYIGAFRSGLGMHLLASYHGFRCRSEHHVPPGRADQLQKGEGVVGGLDLFPSEFWSKSGRSSPAVGMS